jgi:uncharacterized OsmC-like protein
MSVQIAKRWSVNAVSEGQTPLAFFCDGRPLTQTSPATIDNVSPVEYLLIAVASCFALSCRAVLAKRKLARITFEVVATGEKAVASGNRLTHVAVVAVFHNDISGAEAAAITEDAKPLCTVSNTLLAAPDVVYGSRVIKEQYSDMRELHLHHAPH